MWSSQIVIVIIYIEFVYFLYRCVPNIGHNAGMGRGPLPKRAVCNCFVVTYYWNCSDTVTQIVFLHSAKMPAWHRVAVCDAGNVTATGCQGVSATC